jgi:hypothetical protein
MTSAAARASHSGSEGATDTAPTVATLPTLKYRHAIEGLVGRPIDLVQHEGPGLGNRPLTTTQGLDDGLDAARSGA